MPVNRRLFLGLLGSGISAAAFTTGVLADSSDAAATAASCNLLFGAYRDAEGQYGVAALDRAGHIIFAVPLPERAHAIALHPTTARCVVIARRPGTFAAVLDSGSGELKQMLTAAGGRHFYGHGVFAGDESLFYTTENHYDAGHGVIGIRNSAQDYRQAGEWPSYGIGPHQLLLSADGNSLIVANGGILTHPDSGRAQLNPDSMLSSLVRIDRRSGQLIDQMTLEPALRHLSIRHIAETPTGTVLFGMQNQGPPDPALPLVGSWHEDGAVRLYDTPAELTRGYIGSVALDHSGRIAAASAPRDGYIAFWDLQQQFLIGTVKLTDGCGLTATCQAHQFIVSSGAGALEKVSISPGQLLIGSQPVLHSTIYQWDNHLT